MKKVFFFILASTMAISANAQSSSFASWMWVKGDNTSDQFGIYGIQNITAPANKPGARQGTCSWTDLGGNLWMFGGMGYDRSDYGYLNDVWKYDALTNDWIWKSGDNHINQQGVYGLQGMASANNKPGARYGAMSWVDNNGNLWLFGGLGYGSNGATGMLSDLWKFKTNSGEWTWMNGNNSGNQYGAYGIKGVGSKTNRPGGRYGAVSWVDAAGKFWLFGGYGFSNVSADVYLNDLWKYDPETNEWTWVSGDFTGDQSGNYHKQQVSSSLNKPGARFGSSAWQDVGGNLWVMGGYGFASSHQLSLLNDLWRFNIQSNEWTWMKGDTIVDQPGIYGSRGIETATNKPGARYLPISWTDAFGNLWMMGGYGYANNNNIDNYLNDFWRYNVLTNEWTWLKGDSVTAQPGAYGTQGVASMANKPGARYNSVSWSDFAGNLWLLGGEGFDHLNIGNLNDLWKISYSAILSVQDIPFSASLYQHKQSLLQWITSTETNRGHFAVEHSVNGNGFKEIGNIDASNSSSSYRLIHEAPVTGKNYYRLKWTNTNGKSIYSPIRTVDIASAAKWRVSVWPNPATDYSNLVVNSTSEEKISVRLLDVVGRTIWKDDYSILAGENKIPLPASRIFPGVYYLQVSSSHGLMHISFVKK